MPRNGSGTYVRTNGVYTGSTVWAQDRDAGTKITAAHQDTHDQDIADALTASLAKDGQTVPTADLPMGGYKHTGVAAATARNNYGTVAGIQDSTYIWGGTSTGAANTYSITLSPAITAYANGMRVAFLTHQANTSAATLAVNGLTATNIVKNNGNALSANDILNNQVLECIYSPAAGGQWQLVNQSVPALANNQFLKGRNAANSADIDILKVNTSDTVEFGSSYVLAVASGGTGATTAANARTNLGLGTIATQSASSVSISGGTITNVTLSALASDLDVINGGTGASNAADARTNLGAAASGANGDITSLTGCTSIANSTLQINASGSALSLVSSSSVSFTVAGTARATVATTGINPFATNTYTLGTSSLVWQSIYSVGIQGISSANFTVLGQSGRGIDFVVDGATTALQLQSTGLLRFNATGGTSSKNPAVDAVAGWIEVSIAGTARYIPYYAA